MFANCKSTIRSMGKSLGLAQQKPWLWPFCLVLLLIITALAFSKVYGFQFIDWDDQTYIVGNPLITRISLSNFMSFFNTERHTSLALFSFSIDYHFFGLNPGPYHLVNLFIHLINVMLVYLLARKLNIEPIGALTVAVLFALHPARVETVAWVMQRKDLLFTLFFLSGILIYIRYIQKGSRNLLLILFVFLAGYLSLLSKIQAYVFPAVLILIDIYLKRKFDFRNIFEKVFLILIFILSRFDVIEWLFLISTFSLLFLYHFYDFKKTFPFFQKREVLSSAGLSLKQLFKRYIYTLLIIFPCILINKKYGTNLSFVILFYLFGIFFEWFIINKTAKFLSRRILFIAISSAGILALTGIIFIILPRFGIDEGLPVQESSLLQRVIMASFSLSYYIFRFFIPFKLNAVEIYPMLIGGKFPVIYYLSFLLPTAILALLVIYRKKLIKHRAIIIFCLFFFLINIFMVLHLIPIKGRVVVSNRYTYMSYLGFFLLAGYFVSRYSKKIKPKFFLAILAVLAVLLGVYDFGISGSWRNSKNFWNDAISKNSKNFYAWERLGSVFRLEGDNTSAMKAFDRSVAINPLSGSIYSSRGVLKLETGDYSGALKDLNEAIRLQINSAEVTKQKMAFYDYSAVYFNRGNVYLFIKDYSLALQDYDTAISMYNDDNDYFANRSLVKVLLNDIKGAQKDIQSALQINPNNALALYNRGVIALKLNNSVKANVDFSRALAIEPSVADLFLQFGLIADTSGRQPLSDNSSGSTSNFYVDRAIVKARSGNLASALADLNTATDLDPKNPLAYSNRGNVKYDLKDYSGAIADCSRAIELLPDDSKAFFIRAKVYFAKGNRSAACKDWKKASELGDKRADEMLMTKCK